MNATRQVKRKPKKKRAAAPRAPAEWPPKLPPLGELNLSLFDEPDRPDSEDEFDPPWHD